MTAGMVRRVARLEAAKRQARVIVVSDYGHTDVPAEIARQGAEPHDLVVILRKYMGEQPGGTL